MSRGLSLNGFMSDLKSSVKGTDAIIGAVAALGGIAALNYVKSKFSAKVPFLANPTFARFSPLVAGAAAGFGGMMLSKKVLKKPQHANGVLVGAIAAGIFLQGLNELKVRYPAYFADVVDLRLAGLIVDDPYRGGMGMLVDDRQPALNGYADNPNLADLAAMSMGMEIDEETELFGA